MLLGKRAIIGSNFPLPFKKRPTKPKNTLNKKIPKGFGIFSRRLVRTSALPSGRFRSPSKMLGFSRGNTMPRRNAPRQLLTIFLKVQIGGGGGIRTHETFRSAAFQERCLQPLGHPSVRSTIRQHGTRECRALGGVSLKVPERNWLPPTCVETSAGRSAGGIFLTPPPSTHLASPAQPKLLSEGGSRSGKDDF